jgi:tRNA threonylcarbamoyl adenosine modification protein YjeE
MQTHLINEEKTKEFAVSIAAKIIGPTVLCLKGTLGAGKSVLAREIIRALADNMMLDVPSPTFTLLQTYETPKGEIYHYDLYRIEDAEEIFELDWEEAITTKITLVEWPERAGNFLPQRRTEITLSIDPDNSNARFIEIKGYK